MLGSGIKGVVTAAGAAARAGDDSAAAAVARTGDDSAAAAAEGSAITARDAATDMTADQAFARAMALLDCRPQVRGETKVNFFQMEGTAQPFLEAAMSLGHARAYFYTAVLRFLDVTVYQLCSDDEVDRREPQDCEDMPTYLMKCFRVYLNDRRNTFTNEVLIAFRKAVLSGLPEAERDVLSSFMRAIDEGRGSNIFFDKGIIDAFKYHWHEMNNPTDYPTIIEQYGGQGGIDSLLENLIKYESDIIGWDIVMSMLLNVLKVANDYFDCIIDDYLSSSHWLAFLSVIKSELPELATKLQGKIIEDKSIDLVGRLDVAFEYQYMLRENTYERLYQSEKVEDLESLLQTPRGFAKYETVFKVYQRKFEAYIAEVGEAFSAETNPDQQSRLFTLEQDFINRTTAYRETRNAYEAK